MLNNGDVLLYSAGYGSYEKHNDVCRISEPGHWVFPWRNTLHVCCKPYSSDRVEASIE